MNIILDNIALITSLLGGGGVIGWFFGGRQKQAQDIKKADVEIKKSNTDAVKSMQEVYDGFLIDFKERVADLMLEMAEIKAHNKDLQTQFNNLFIQLAKETEKSLNWEKLHAELAKKFNELQKEHDSLKKAFDNLKKLMK